MIHMMAMEDHLIYHKFEDHVRRKMMNKGSPWYRAF
jgi:hypothetical protein